MPTYAKSDSGPPVHPLRGSFKSIGQMLTEDLRKTILSGALEEGEYLRQRSLARRYGVSEVVVRESLRRLEAEGLVEAEPRKGVRVSRLSPAEVTEIWELRILIEKLLTQYAVPVVRQEDLARAEGLVCAMSAEREAAAWLSLNREFHDCLYRPAGRLRILRFANTLRDLIDRYLRMRLEVLRHYEIAEREHRSLLSAYRRGDAALAVKRIEAHLRRTADSVVAFLASRKN